MVNFKKISQLIMHPMVTTKKYNKIILLSHMRSRSSVLSHILGSNGEISGYYEQHLNHNDPLFDIKIKANLILDQDLSFDHTYLYDKVLHERFDPLDLKGYKVIVLIRNPNETLKSIISMEGDIFWEGDYYRAFAYYCQRLQSIIDMVLSVDSDILFIDADDLVNNSSAVLNKMTLFLGLKDHLSHHYQSFEKTGKPIYGDPSDNIKSGSIIKTEVNSKAIIPDELLAIAQDYYDRCQKLCLKK
jgi:hypothetical protein